jgi:hypothetical protein
VNSGAVPGRTRAVSGTRNGVALSAYASIRFDIRHYAHHIVPGHRVIEHLPMPKSKAIARSARSLGCSVRPQAGPSPPSGRDGPPSGCGPKLEQMNLRVKAEFVPARGQSSNRADQPTVVVRTGLNLALLHRETQVNDAHQ